MKEVSDQLRHCYLQLKEDSGLLAPETLHAFGIITEEQHHSFYNTTIAQWLCGRDALGLADSSDDRSFVEVLLRTREIDFSCVENEENRLFDDLKSPVVLFVSCSAIEKKISQLNEEGSGNEVPPLQRLLESIRNGLGNPEIPQLEHVDHLRNLRALNMIQRWQLYR